MGNSARKLATGLSAAFPLGNSASIDTEHPERSPFWSQTAHGWILPIILASGWELLARAGIVDTSLFSSPSQIAAELVKLAASGELLAHLETTFLRVVSGFAIGVSAATLLGAVIGYSGFTRRLVDPTLQSLRSIPSMAWVPLFLLWLGIGESSKIALIALGVFFPVYLNLMNAVRSVDRKLVEVGLANGFRGFALVKTVVLPASLPAYLVGLRQGLSLGWMFVVAAEIMGASRGLGYLLIDGQATGRPAIMIASVILFAICGKVSDGLLAALSERWLYWQDVYRT
ncbi:MAG TPA: ABC transporter permease [Chthoniobacterales bacterium]|nr:ABC transporter permease [Chthoniobacterales bacterium]